MSHDTPLVIAHRATMGHAPENTLMGIRQALDMRCDGVEVDVQLSADGVPVLFHDDELQRTTNATGPLADRTYAELQRLEAGEGEPVPSLRDALQLVDGQMLFVAELKISPHADVPALCDAVLAEIDRAGALPWIWLWSFDSATVIELSRRSPRGRRIAHLCIAPTPDIWQIAAEHQLDGISMHGSGLTASNVAACRTHDMAAFVWTVNERADIRHCIELGVTGIVGDYPERIQAALSDDPD
ncbi:MAG: glycerophosphodiester phosphodiesterase [Chloroflexi bacterium]|nr:glycerophosphodiester phosphodiesterase [Chloroflexota bacterium]MCY3686570.1 glycerophosphodiester phosphodiesterase [Chloroflexota bacterium]MDE2708294.1 glycerophosphodiester phosphodiesterase [Chloroflexota bacterium]